MRSNPLKELSTRSEILSLPSFMNRFSRYIQNIYNDYLDAKGATLFNLDIGLPIFGLF